MKISEGFIAVTAEGEYLYFGKSQSHVGTRFYCQKVKEIEQATVRPYPREERGEDFPQGTKWLPVKVTRTVELTGWGSN